MPEFAQMPPKLSSKTISVALVGCGGNGSSMLLNLARLNFALKELGHPGGLHVTAIDGDFISETNVGRQCFFESDIGLFKASTLIQRLNMAYGTNWDAHNDYVEPDTELHADVVIVAVDSAKARILVDGITRPGAEDDEDAPIVLDLGNGSDFGQIILGNFGNIPHPYDQLPALIDESKQDPTAPSCSMAEALRTQELFVNSMAVTLASQLLWELFRKGKTNKAGFYFNLKSGKTAPILVSSFSVK